MREVSSNHVLESKRAPTPRRELETEVCRLFEPLAGAPGVPMTFVELEELYVACKTLVVMTQLAIHAAARIDLAIPHE